MAQGGGNERETLGKFVKTQSGYGTTTSSKKHTQHKSSKFIKHMLTKEDNLVGLSLKYQCTVEVLKRENKLWNNDMLFLREHVLIPLSPENEHLAPPETVVTFSERERTGSVNSNGSNNPPDKETNEEVTSGKEEVQIAAEVESCKKESNPLDFFSKYDSSLAKLKSDVAKMEKNAEFLSEIDSHNPLQFLPRKGSTSSQGSRRTISFEDTPNSPVLVIRTRTQARMVQDSLEKSQKANDDLFEL